jgi:hypothetical protein
MLVGVVLAVTVPVGLAYGAAGGFSRFRDHQTPGVVALSGPITAVEITGLNGDVRVNGDPAATGVTGTSLVEYHEDATKPQLTMTVDGGVAKLAWTCPGGHCDGAVMWHVTVPGAAKVTVASSNASLDLDFLTGEIVATTSNAGIDARHLGSGNATFQTRNADITARFDGAPTLISANTSDADVEIGTDGKTEAFDDVQTSNGNTEISNPGAYNRFASRTVQVRTTNGNVTIH